MLRNPGTNLGTDLLGCNLKEGDAGEVSDALGIFLVKASIAQEVLKKEIIGVAKAPEIGKPVNQTKPNPTKILDEM